ncbi:MAG: aldehyde dehydrogenase family protein, partial [Pseudomonadota bacterium]|nr:aldehyde dehydrogenase family protein [Pseudomonadota bacterium]
MSDALPDPFTPALFLNPAYQTLAGTGTVLDNPSTLEPVGVFGAPTASEIDAVLARVNAAQKGWAATDPKARARVLHRVADAIEAGDMGAVAKRMTLETGKPFPEAIGEIANIAPVFRYYAE